MDEIAVNDTDAVRNGSFTELFRQMSNEPVQLPWYKSARHEVDEGLDSIYEVAARHQKPLLAFIQEDPEYAVMIVEMSYAKWTNILTQVSLTGGIATEDGQALVTKTQMKALEVRLKQAESERDTVTDYAMSFCGSDEKKRDHLLRTLYMNAVLRRDTKAITYLIDRIDGRPGETRVAELSYDNAYNIYMILHTLFDRQLEVLNTGNGTILVCCSRRAGKCWSPDTLLRRYDGTLVMAKDVVVGDIMMGAHNEPQKVLSTTTGKDQMFRIRSKQDGCRIDFTCNSVHVLTVRFAADLSRTRSAYKDVYKKGEIYDIPLNEFLQLPAYIRSRFNLMRQRISYSERQHIIDPYILGLWLGDGDKMHPRIAVGVNEAEIMTAITDYCNKNDFEFSIRHQSHSVGECYEVCIKSGKVLPEELRRLDIEGNKHIPEEYLIDSVENRLQLLAGLIDSDGCLDKRGNLGFYNTDKALVDTVVELCDSLGFRTTVNKQVKEYWSEAHSVMQTVEVFNVFIKGKRSEIPCRCPRKQAKDSTQSLDYGFYITPVGEGDYAGFTLDGDGRLLLSDYTITHNTHMLVAESLIECMRKPNTTCIYVGETMQLTEDLVDDAVNKLIESCHLQDKKGNRFNWRKMDNGSKLLVRGLSNTKDPDQIRGRGAKIIVIDEFFHLKSELLEYIQREVLKPMQMDYAGDYKFICAGTPPSIKGSFGEMAWKTWTEVPHFKWTWRENPYPSKLEDREAYVEKEIHDMGLTWDTPFVRREYLGEWSYDDDLVLYPNYKTWDPDPEKDAMPQWNISRVLFGIDYGVSDNDTLVGIAWSDDEGKGYEFFECKFSRLDIKDHTMSQLEYLKIQVMTAWDQALNYFGDIDTPEAAKQANRRILWDADDNDQHMTQELGINCKFQDEIRSCLSLQIANAHKTDKKLMWDKIDEMMRTGRLLIMKGGKLEQECISTILLRGPNGEIYSEIDEKAYHPDLLPAMRYALWNVAGL